MLHSSARVAPERQALPACLPMFRKRDACHSGGGKVSKRSAPQGPNDIQQAIKHHNAASHVRKLITKGCEESRLINGLGILQAGCNFDESWKGLIGQAWPGFHGDLKRRFERSIRQIRECAAEIKRLERTEFFALFFPPGSPSTLVLTARALDGYAERLSEVMRQVGPKKHPLRSWAKAQLVVYVKEATGHWYDEHLAPLIEAATSATYESHTHLEWRRANDQLIRCAVLLRQINRQNPTDSPDGQLSRRKSVE